MQGNIYLFMHPFRDLVVPAFVLNTSCPEIMYINVPYSLYRSVLHGATWISLLISTTWCTRHLKSTNCNLVGQFSQSYRVSWYYHFFFYQLMHKRIALKGILKFTLKQLLHVSVQPPSSGSVLFELAKVTVVKIIN